jgi:tetratricopeptide (TPR) repeat protein
MAIAAGLVAVALAGTALIVQRLDSAEQFRQLMAAGDEALASGGTYAAIESYSGAIALRTDSMLAHLRRGEAYRQQRRLEEAARDFREAARLQPGATDPLLALAQLSDGRGASADAAEWYARAAAVDSRSPTILYRLALAHYRSGQAAQAIDPLKKALAIDADLAEAWYLLGVASRDTQDMAGARDALERAVQANPALTAAREELADLYATLGRPADEMRQLVALAAQDATPRRAAAIGLAQARQGQFDAALATIRTASASDPSTLALAEGRVLVLQAAQTTAARLRQAIAGEAVTAIERALGGTARRSEGLALYGRALYLRGQLDDAERILREAVATSPFSPQAVADLADVYEALNRPADAATWLLRYDVLLGDAVSRSARQARTRRLGHLALLAGDVATARTRLESLGSVDASTDADVLAWLTEARWQAGDAAGAREALARLSQLAPRDTRLRRLRQMTR